MVANRLKKVRKAKQLTQQEVADALNFSRQSLSKWENGTGAPNIETLKKLSAFYEISIADLTAEKEDMLRSHIFKRDIDESWLLVVIIILSIPLAPFGILTMPIVFLRNKKENALYKLIISLVLLVLVINFIVVSKLITTIL